MNYSQVKNIENQNISQNSKELNEIFSQIQLESKKNPPYKSVKLLCIYLNKNRNNSDEIIKRISLFLNNNDSLNDLIMLNIINSIQNILTENSQVITFLNMMLPILIHSINYGNREIKLIDNILETIGNLIKIGEIYTRQIIENNIDSLFDKFSNEYKNFKDNRIKYSNINLFTIIIKNSPLIAYNKIIDKNNIEIVLKIIEFYQDKQIEIRNSIGKLIESFSVMFYNRGESAKKNFNELIYGRIFNSYKNHLEENYDIPYNSNITCGFITVIKSFKGNFFKNEDKYKKLCDILMKCTLTKSTTIKIDFLQILPFLIEINVNFFVKEYSTNLFNFIKSLLNPKDNILRNSLLECIGKMVLILPDDEIIPNLNFIIKYIKSILFEKKIYDGEVFQCLSDFLQSQGGIYKEIILKNFDIYLILPNMFITGITNGHLNYILELLSTYHIVSTQQTSILIVVLNVISILICKEDFELVNFNKNKISNIIYENLPKLIDDTKKTIKSYLNKYKDSNEEIINSILSALTLLSKITNRLFIEDIFIFYHQKILKYLTYSISNIKQKTIELSLAPFMKIYPNNKNLSLYILNNVLDAFLNLIINEPDVEIKYFCLNILCDNKTFYPIFNQNKNIYLLKIISFLSIEDNKIRELSSKLIGNICKYLNENNYFFVSIRKVILTLLDSFQHSTDIIKKEDLVLLLYNLTIYTKECFNKEIIYIIIKHIIYLLKENSLNPVINSNSLKIFCELIKEDYHNTYFKNEKLIINDEYYDLILKVCIKNIQEGINTYGIHVSLKTLLYIIKVKKMNIYNNISLVNLLFQILTKDLNEKNLEDILNIFNYCGSISPEELKKINFNNSKININKKINAQDLINNNSNLDESTCQAVVCLMNILKDNIQIELSTQIISCLGSLIKSLQPFESDLINIILPTMIEIIPDFEISYVKNMFENMILILEKFPNNFKLFLKSFIQLIKKYIFEDNYNDIIFHILSQIFEKFENEMKNYYYILIPIFLKLIRDNSKEIKNIIYCFILMTNNDTISSYLDIIFDEIFFLYKKTKDNEIINQILHFILKVINNGNSLIYFPIIIQNMIEKIKIDNLDSKLIFKNFEIFDKMNSINRNHFIGYLPQIIKILKEKNIITQYYQKIKLILENINYNLISKTDLKIKLKSQLCSLNILSENNSQIENKTKLENNIIKNRKTQTDKDLIIKKFKTSNRKVEDDWKEWFKSTSKILFEQSPSYSLFYCHMIADYYFPLINELYNYGFISVWNILLDSHKKQIVKELNVVLEHSQTPNNILLIILNLAEFMERKKGNFDFMDFSKLGNIALKCKAYAKAIYYKENDFINKNDYDIFEQLIELYYKVKLPESAIGLLKLFKKQNKNSIYKNEYIWYIKLHQYKEGLDCIEEILKNENLINEDKKDIIIKDKIICLEGLCDWEELLKISNNCDSIKDDIDMNFIMAKASLNLSNWDDLQKYNKNIENYFNRISSVGSNNTNSKDFSIYLDNNKNINDDKLFDYNLFNIIISINQKDYKNANEYIKLAKENIYSKIKSLLLESYARGYELMIKDQMLYQLKEIIKYEKDYLNDNEYKKKMINQWDKRLDIISKDPFIFERILSIRSLVLNMNEDYINYLKLAKIWRKNNQFEQSKKVLERIKYKLLNLENNNIEISKDIKISIELSINKCLFEDGKIEESISNSKKIIELIEDEKNNCQISNILKSKVYGLYGMYCFKSLNLEDKKDNKKIIENISNYLSISTKYNEKNYNAWHNFAMLNNSYYEYLLENNLEINLNYAKNAIQGFTNSIIIGEKNKNKFQDILRLIDLFFKCGSSTKEIKNLINESFNNINIDCFLDVIPQLICRIDIGEKDKDLFEILKNLLIKIGKYHLKLLGYHLIVMNNYKSKKRKEASGILLNILSNLNKENEELIKQWILFINELNRCAVLLHEEWHEAIEECAKYIYEKKDINKLISVFLPLHQKLKKKPETLYEIHFYQLYKTYLNEAEENIKNYLETKEIIYIKQSWEIYHTIYRKIKENFQTFQSLYLKSISPKLYNFKESKITIPSINKNSNIFISHINPNLEVLKTKQHPRKILMYGTDEKEYIFLLKGHEDLRQDERAMQLFNLVNSLLSIYRNTNNKNLYINTYSVLPLSYNTGIIGWVSNCDTLHQLIKEQRSKNNILPTIEYRTIFYYNHNFESSSFLKKIEIFEESLKTTQGNEINKILWIKSLNCEKWLERRINFSRSLALMSIVGYILGLGDRHPNNLMMEKNSGNIIHIDFGDCFEVAMKRDKFPEKVPFRLTRMLIKALEVSGIEGNFRITCENVMRVLRINKNSLLAILASFIHDPLVSFRLMIPMLMKRNKNSQDKKIFNENEQVKHKKERIKSGKSKFVINNNNNDVNDNNNNLINNNNNIIGNDNNTINNINPKKKNSDNIDNNIKNDNYGLNNELSGNIIIIEEDENYEKNKMENDERQILMLLEERDEIESEELNKIAKIVLDRIKDKLSGKDFNKNIIYDTKMQVQKLISQATSHENLAQSYLGWCPFW